MGLKLAPQRFNVSFIKRNLVKESDLRSDRLSPLNKPRSITRKVTEEMLLSSSNKSENPQQPVYKDFDLSHGAVFCLEQLNPVETAKFFNLEAMPYAFETSFDVLLWASAILTRSPLALSLIQHAKKQGWKFALNDLGTNGFHLDAAEKIIELDNYGLDEKSLGKSAFFRLSLLNVFSKALREIWHEEKWGAFETIFKPESVLMLERARTADADSVSVVIAWQLRAAGYNDIWRHIVGSDDGDMAQVLVNILERYPTAIYNGMALAHVFRQWYADLDRVDALDYCTLEQIDYMMTDQSCNLGCKTAMPGDFEKLSVLPDEICYLKELGETVGRDPFFNDIQDPINQAHLFQIIYDSEITYVGGIPFRDQQLARKFLKAD